MAPLRELVASLRPAYDGLGWVAPERWHVTLAFLGDVPEPKLAKLDLAAVAARIAPFPLRVAGGGSFSRVYWAGLDGDVAALDRLARSVAVAARQARIAPDRTPFRPHLTLARVRRPGVSAGDLVERLSEAAGPEWSANRIVLMRSHLGPAPRYEPLDSWPLCASPAGAPTPASSPKRGPQTPPAP